MLVERLDRVSILLQITRHPTWLALGCHILQMRRKMLVIIRNHIVLS
jgi:hypothetical protein